MKRFIVAILCGALLALNLSAKGNTNWVVEQTVVLPSTITINEGLTKNGNPKCWIVIENMKVSVSPSNAAKFKAGEIQIELVKWRNSETNKIKYSTRQAGGRKSSSSTKDIDLKTLFK